MTDSRTVSCFTLQLKECLRVPFAETLISSRISTCRPVAAYCRSLPHLLEIAIPVPPRLLCPILSLPPF